jgi:hypothetical protein
VSFRLYESRTLVIVSVVSGLAVSIFIIELK